MRFKRHRKRADTLQAEKKPFFMPGRKAQSKEEPRKPGIKISSPNDKSEKQADAIADRVVNRTKQTLSEEPAIIQNQEKSAFAKASADKEEEPAAKLEVQRQEEEEAAAKLELQRQEEDEGATAAKLELYRQEEEETSTKLEVQRQEEEETSGKLEVQRQAEEEPTSKLEIQRQEEEKTSAKSLIQRKEDKGNTSPFEDRVKIAKSGGNPLPDKTRKELEHKLKADFNKVRIHVNDNAIKLCSEIKHKLLLMVTTFFLITENSSLKLHQVNIYWRMS